MLKDIKIDVASDFSYNIDGELEDRYVISITLCDDDRYIDQTFIFSYIMISKEDLERHLGCSLLDFIIDLYSSHNKSESEIIKNLWMGISLFEKKHKFDVAKYKSNKYPQYAKKLKKYLLFR